MSHVVWIGGGLRYTLDGGQESFWPQEVVPHSGNAGAHCSATRYIIQYHDAVSVKLSLKQPS